MRLLTSGLIVALLATALYLVWTPDKDLRKNGSVYESPEKPIILKNPDMTDFADGRLTMRIKARTARVFENKKLTLLSKVDGTLYPDPGQEDRKPTLVKAESGTIWGNSQLITLQGNVRVFFGDGQKLFTQEMNLDRKKELLYNEVDVRVLSDEHRIDAKQMKYDMKTGVLVLVRPKAWINAGDL